MLGEGDTVEGGGDLADAVGGGEGTHEDDGVGSGTTAAEIEEEGDQADERTTVEDAAEEIECGVAGEGGQEYPHDLHQHGRDDHREAAVAVRQPHPEDTRGDAGHSHQQPGIATVPLEPRDGVVITAPSIYPNV